MTPFESTEGMSESCKTALRNLLLACADTKLLLGYHYGEWTFGPPEIEAAIACCSLCQTELGHVRLLHGILTKHYGDDPDMLVESRTPSEFANIAYLDREIKDWAEFVAANYVVDLALTALLHAMRKSSFKPLHMSLEKMLQEERYHIHHGQGWFRALARKSSQTKRAITRTARQALAAVVEWYGPGDSQEDQELVAAGIKSESNAQILARVVSEVGDLSDKLGIDLGLVKTGDGWQVETPLSWKGWNAASRRFSSGGPEEEILYHLRGSKNKVFKLS
ncbi:MAG: Phenylacetic acid catabolic protein [bacterium]